MQPSTDGLTFSERHYLMFLDCFGPDKMNSSKQVRHYATQRLAEGYAYLARS